MRLCEDTVTEGVTSLHLLGSQLPIRVKINPRAAAIQGRSLAGVGHGLGRAWQNLAGLGWTWQDLGGLDRTG